MYEVSVWSKESLLELEVMVAQHGDYNKITEFYTLKLVSLNFISIKTAKNILNGPNFP